MQMADPKLKADKDRPELRRAQETKHENVHGVGVGVLCSAAISVVLDLSTILKRPMIRSEQWSTRTSMGVGAMQ